MIQTGGNFRKKALCFAALAAVYLALFAGLGQTPLYDISNTHNDRFFSADEVYYVESFYAPVMDASPRVIKHPLLVVFAHWLTLAERALFGPVSTQHHYMLIVGMQLICALLSAVYLYKILEERYGLPFRQAAVFCGVYALAFSTLFYTFIAESYILSSLLLIMSYYYAPRRITPLTMLLGVLAAGVTTTNAFLWAVIVLFSGGSLKYRARVIVGGGLLFCLVVAALPIREGFFSYIILGSARSVWNYSDRFFPLEMLKRVFFIFFGSTAFYLDTMEQSPFGEFVGDALSFLPSAPAPVLIMALGWLALLVCSAVVCRKDERLLAPLGVLLVNFALHGIVQYGLKEGFLYSLHHFSAQILISALLFSPDREAKPSPPVLRAAAVFTGVFLLAEAVLNVPGYLEMLEFLNR